MGKILVDARDARFVLFEQLETHMLLSPELRAEYDRETLEMILSEAEKLAGGVLAACNKEGDRLGCRFEDGSVSVPASFKRAYMAFSEGGWNVISDSREVGGQGLPKTIEICCREFFEAANMSMSNYFNLTHAAGKLIEIFGTPEQKEVFLDKLYTAKWCGTMCLTEPDAGTDVGAVKTVARRNRDGSYSIKGTKLFITNGEHELTENIIHMVLARIEGDPEGTRGLSLFIVPKVRVGNGNLKEPNDVICTGIEEKLGCHGSCTCSLNFGDQDNCIGYLIGEERQGIMVMFHMMNEARLLVGSQGLAQGSAAYLEALRYAQERFQGVHFTNVRNPGAPIVPIIEHPDIRYTLMKMKAYVEGCRALVYFHAHSIDRVELTSSKDEKIRWQSIVELLTPVCKAYSSDRGFEICSAALQILGGYGYSKDFPIEQYLRDERVTQIYEGTNGIQAIDLLTRKIVMKDGSAFQCFLEEIDSLAASLKSRKRCLEYVSMMETYKSLLIEARSYLTEEMRSKNLGLALSKASRFLEFFGDVTLAWLWLWQMSLAEEKLDSLLHQRGMSKEDFDVGSPNDNELAFYAGKIQTGRFYFERLMPAIFGKVEEIKAKGENFLELAPECL